MDERWVDVDGNRLWVGTEGSGTPVLLVMGAASDSTTWPAAFVSALATRHQVIVYDHRDTGLSSHLFAEKPYRLVELASDAVAVLDGMGISAAHVVGMSMGGTLAQVVLVDHPERVLSAALFCTGALGAEGMPGPSDELLELWSHLGDSRSLDEEIDYRVEHWRLLNGGVLPFVADEFAARERASIAREGSFGGPVAHALAAQDGLSRSLAGISTPVLVLEAPEDPTYPPPNASYLASAIGSSARLVEVPGMGHALPSAVLERLSSELLDFWDSVDRAG